MEKILFLAHVDSEGRLPKLALETLSAASQISGGQFQVALIGDDTSQAANQIGSCGADAFFSVSGEAFSESRYATDAAATEALVQATQATLVIAPSTSRFARAIPGAAARLNGAVDTRINAIDASGEELSIQRWFYRQRLLGSISKKKRPWFLLLDSGLFNPWSGDQKKVATQAVSVELTAPMTQTRVLGVEKPSSDSQTIKPDSHLLFVAGAGWSKKQSDGGVHVGRAEKTIVDFLSVSGASLGSSKSLVDQSSEGQEVLSFMSHLNQVGQTGSSPRHPKGLATCCHGEEPHVVGWRFINERRAINTDANCGWARGKADVVYVADAFEVMEKVNQLLNK